MAGCGWLVGAVRCGVLCSYASYEESKLGGDDGRTIKDYQQPQLCFCLPITANVNCIAECTIS
jgi:hypothetical protein